MREPRWRRYLRFWRPSAERDVDDELRFHLEARIEELRARGLRPDEARAAAADRFGDMNAFRPLLVASTRRRLHRASLGERTRIILQELRFSLRGLRREPLLAVAIVFALGAGIGANAAMFDIADRLLLRPPTHVRDAQHVVRMYAEVKDLVSGQHYTGSALNYPIFQQLATLPAFDRVAGYATFAASVGTGAAAWHAHAALVTSSFFPLLGTRPILGRAFLPEEEQPGYAQPGVVLSYEAWRSHFGGDSAVLGRHLEISGWKYPVVGIAPPEFSGVELQRVDLWLPLSAADHGFFVSDWAINKFSYWLTLLARLRPGVPPRAAEAQATARFRAATATVPMHDSTALVHLKSVVGARNYNMQPPPEARVSAWLSGIAGVVLLIACANVATLLLLRAMRRRRELAIRRAVGMSAGRLLGHLMLESFLLAAAGGIAALVAMRWVGGALRALLLPDVAWGATTVDLRVLGLTTLGVLLAGFVTALIPALSVGRRSLSEELRSGGHGVAWHRSSVHAALLVGQGALTVALLVGAGLFLRSVQRAEGLDFGYDRSHVLEVQLEFPARDAQHARDLDAIYARALQRVSAIPGVTHAGISDSDPGGWSYGMSLSIPGRDSLPRTETGGPYGSAVTPDYFAAIGTRILRGRGFTAADVAGSERVVVVSKGMADLYWPGADPLGTCVKVDDSADCTRVVGIAQDIRQYGITDKPRLWLYVPWAQATSQHPSHTLFVHTVGDPSAMELTVRQAVQSLDPTLPFVSVKPLESVLDPQLRPWRLGTTMLSAFGLLAMALAALGLYSVVAYSVSQRRREMGIRLALGAQRRIVARLVLRDAVRIALTGAVMGALLGAGFGHFVRDVLFQPPALDLIVIAVAALSLVLASVLASLVPAWRAGGVDIAAVLRAD
ncbi:MAG TPA: ADOP family duplicated permease [Gemmatimonadaceae bacterium]|nr:ADOP family duplicated permease [Gemmatimonadaceae bacterium]